MITKTITGYTIEELKEQGNTELIEKIIEKNRSINTELGCCLDIDVDNWKDRLLSEYGIEANKIYYSIRFCQGDYVAIDGCISDLKLFMRKHKMYNSFRCFYVVADSDYVVTMDERRNNQRVTVYDDYASEKCDNLFEDFESTVTQGISELADTIMYALQEQILFMNSDDQVLETLEANEYHFDANGEII